ncbi:MAG TPA: DUF6503 family protein [Chitinophagaceae bacterium]|nr:DUF6503 family protein [Chitinophagaceae bacterium]
MRKNFIVTIILFIVVSCNNKKPKDDKATIIVEQSITAHGGNNYKHMDVSFDYRKFRIHLVQNDGNFLYERTTKDSPGNVINDVLTNEGFTRKINGEKQDLSPKDYEKYKDGLNAIPWFALLPYKLSEPAVNLKYLGEINIGNITYDKIDVTFDKEAGGKDHQDEFCFWINKNSHTLDYLSYSNEGPRFRKVTKRQRVDGIIFQDYDNYKISDTTISTADYDKVFIAGNAKLLSKIEQNNYTSNRKK